MNVRLISECATFERVDGLLRYVPLTGIFYWKVSLTHSIKVGDEAGSPDKNGYILIKIDGKLYRAHRIAHLLMTGHWPEGEPDHENRNPSDNSWINICDTTTHFNNCGNQGVRVNNSSGLKGVHWSIRDENWQVLIRVMGKRVYLGNFQDKREAGLMYDAAAKLAWGTRFSCLNFPLWESDHIVLPDRVIQQIESQKLLAA